MLLANKILQNPRPHTYHTYNAGNRFLRGEERLRLAASEQEAGGQTRSQLDSQDKGQIKGYTLGETGI